MDNRQVLDIAQFIDWKCDKCGATNTPAVGIKEPESEELENNEEIIIEQRDAVEEDMKDNILEGLK